MIPTRAGTIVALAAAIVFNAHATAADNSPPRARTLRSFGATGDGHTDDRAAIAAALQQAAGGPVDGEGLTYAVRGNVEVNTNVDLRNATLLQTMDPPDTRKFFPSRGTLKVEPADALQKTLKGVPVLRPDGIATYSENPNPTNADLTTLLPAIVLRTLAIHGTERTPVSVHLERVKIDRGKHPESGGRTDGAGIHLENASPVRMRDVEITGDGKGTGLMLSRCSHVHLDALNIHDMNWAPYPGDDVFDKFNADEIREDFGWNIFPIYEFRAPAKRFVRVRIQEQLVGIFMGLSSDIEVLNSRIERLQTEISGQLYPLQSDGMTIGNTEHIVIRHCDIVRTWEAIDFTGKSGKDLEVTNCTAADTIGWAFKIAHPKQHVRYVDCTATRGGIAGFLIGAESEDVELLRCHAVDTAGNGYWNRADGSRIMTMSGIRIQGSAGSPTPRDIRIVDCTATNEKHPGAIDYGILCQAPESAARDIKLVNFKTSGAKIRDVEGIKAQP
jgi:hypothetical protein